MVTAVAAEEAEVRIETVTITVATRNYQPNTNGVYYREFWRYLVEAAHSFMLIQVAEKVAGGKTTTTYTVSQRCLVNICRRIGYRRKLRRLCLSQSWSITA